jgi:hypothetical protein
MSVLFSRHGKYTLLFLGTLFLCASGTSANEALKKRLSKVVDSVGTEAFDALVKQVESNSRAVDSLDVCNGRLTLTSATPVTTSDVTAATTLYYTPYNGNKLSLYSGSRWQQFNFSELSISLPSTTSTSYDVFAYNNSGVAALELLAWTNGTTRATALVLQDGIDVKSGATTRRYLGTVRTSSSSGQTEDSTKSRLLWNRCNRVARKLLAQASTASWTYTTATWRAANNDTTLGTTRVEFILGQVAEVVKLEVWVPQVGTGGWAAAGIGINSTSTNSSSLYGVLTAEGNYPPVWGSYLSFPAAGYNYAQWLEWAEATGTVTWYASNNSGARLQAGLTGEVWQ